MKPTPCQVNSARDLIEMVVACAPLDWSDGPMRQALVGIMQRAIAHGLTYGADWGRIWPESDGEWEGVLNETTEYFGGVDLPMRTVPAATTTVAAALANDDGLYERAMRSLERMDGWDAATTIVDGVRTIASACHELGPEFADCLLDLAVASFEAGYDWHVTRVPA